MTSYWIVVAGCLAQAFACAPAIAKEDIPTNNSGDTPVYFQPKSTDGEPARWRAGCGNDGTRVNAFQRDLGQGVMIFVMPAYDDDKLLSVNLIFRYHEKGALKIQPEKFELHALQSQKIFHPGKLYRSTSPKKDPDDVYYEEVYLEFSIPPESAQHIAVVFPEGTAHGYREALTVNPVVFDRAGQPAGGSKSKLTPCIYLTEPPSRLDASRLHSLPTALQTAIPPPPPPRTLNLRRMTGAWVVDGKASAEYFRNSPPPSMNEFLSRAEGMFLILYEFGDEVVFVSTAAGAKRTPYRFLSEEKESGKFTYKNAIQKDTDGDLLVMSAVSGDRIRIHSLRDELTRYFLYKRAKWDLKENDQRSGAAKEAVEAFKGFVNALSPGSEGKTNVGR